MRNWIRGSALAGILIVTLAGGCSKPVAPQSKTASEAYPMAALFQYSRWDGAEISQPPWLVIYNDGTVIRRQFESPRVSSSYWKAQLTNDELAELTRLQIHALNDPSYTHDYPLSDAFDDSQTVLYFGGATGGTASKAYGLWHDESGSRVELIDLAYMLPQPWVGYYVFMLEMLHSTREWTPYTRGNVAEPPEFVGQDKWRAALAAAQEAPPLYLLRIPFPAINIPTLPNEPLIDRKRPDVSVAPSTTLMPTPEVRIKQVITNDSI